MPVVDLDDIALQIAFALLAPIQLFTCWIVLLPTQ